MYYIGERFGRLYVLGFSHKKNTRNFVFCKCDCGKIKVLSTSDLKTGRVKSCGCLNRERLDERTKNKIKNVRLNYVFIQMRQRCNNPNNKNYYNYGGRGIKVCDEWNRRNGYRCFEAWALANGYKPGLTLDRIDNNGPYSPENCRWVSLFVQANNKRTTTRVIFNGVEYTLKQLAQATGVPYRRLKSRICVQGWSPEKAVYEPLHLNQYKLA